MSRILHRAMVLVGMVFLVGPGFGSPVTLGQECSESKLLASDGASQDYFGLSVALSGDVAIVGAYEDDDNGSDSGSAYIYRYDGSLWIEEAKLLASDGASDDGFGASVAIDGDVAVVGAFEDDDNGDDSGSVYIYRFDGWEWIEEAKLLPLDGAEDDLFGASVALEGSLVIIGALGDDDNGSGSGSAYVYRFDGTDWVEEAKLLASDGVNVDHFGLPVAVSGDVVVVGASFVDDNGENSGSAYVFRFEPDESRWVEEAKLLASDGASDDYFGNPVRISGDVVVVGAFADDDNGDDSGSAYVFRFDGIAWTEEAKLLASDGVAGDYFGYSVAVSGDVAVVGAIYGANELSATGSVYVYLFDGIEWIQEDKLLAPDGASGDLFGASVAISGAAIMVGAYSDSDNGWNSGSAYVFDCDCNDNGVFDLVDLVEGTSQDCTGNQIPDECEPDCNGNAVADSCDIASGTSQDSNGNVIPDECELVDGSCTETKLLASDGGSNDRFGKAVALSGDVLVVGADDDDNENGTDAGSVYVYRLVSADWIEEAKLLASDGESDDSFGYSVAVDGDVILVGAARDDSGSVYVYRFDGTDWIQETKLVESDAGIDDTFFGSSVAIDGALAVVGASGFATGSAYVYRFDGSLWVEEAELLASDGQEGDLFGQSVAVSDDTAIIGAYWDMDDAFNPGSGSAYVFHFDGLDWIEEIKLVPADNADGDMFGYSVAMSGDLAIIGAPADDYFAECPGSAYVYSREGTDWVEQAKLVASDCAGDDDFGWSVGITGHWAIVGARLDDENGSSSGSAYLYRFDGTHWTETSKFLASDGGWSNWFGSSVAIGGAVVVIGASGSNGTGSYAGSAYVFVCDCNGNGVFDMDDILEGTSQDCSGNQIPDECEPDCNGNAVADSCDIVAGTSLDCNANGIPDECLELEDDCNANGYPDQCDVADGDSPDCNGNGVPDECDIDGGMSGDCNGDGIPDECDAIRFVDDQAPPGQCGLSWETAYDDLQAALMAAGESGGLVTQIWVAAGTYTPAEWGGDRGATFQLINNVALYGGFAGTETSPDQRDWETNETILSGDLNGNDGPDFENNEDNSYHVVTAGGTDATALLDGFIITAGNANGGGEDDDGAGIYNDGGSPTLANCLLTGNSAADDGAGMFNGAGAAPQLTACTLIANAADGSGAGLYNLSADPLLTNCVIAGNVAQGSGGGVYNLFSSPALTNCVLSGNSSVSFGGGMYNIGLGTEPVLINCTFAGNTASASGGGIYNSVSSVVPSLTNCILWENGDQGGMDESSQIHGGTPQVNYSCIQGLDTLEGNGNIGEDPLFVDSAGGDGIPGTEDDDLRLLSASPCIDAADNEAVPLDTTDLDADGDTSEPIPHDLDGNPRFVDDPATQDTGNPGELGLPVVDMGAYEFQIEEVVCEGDANGDGLVNPLDTGFVLARFGCPVGTGDPNCDAADQNDDGSVDPLDIGFILARFGPCG